ncbi:MAG: bifunctional nuclease family protein [Polyangiaceae bacterium]|nr:bifunctional nuclease family protein [Polyangiaceae bacterium]
MAPPLRRAVWVTLLAGAWLLACSRSSVRTGDAGPRPRSEPIRTSSVVRDEARATTNGDPRDTRASSSTVPKGYVPVTVAGVTPTPAGAAVLLLHDASRRVVPVFVGGTEAMSIELRLEHKRYARPLTHDLLDAVLNKVGATVTSVRVEKLEGGTYYATIVVDFEGKQHELDARSSDAVAIALGHGAPIQMAEAIVVKAGVSVDALDKSGALDGGSRDAETDEKAAEITL